MAVPTNPNLASINYANIAGTFVPYNVIAAGSGITASTSLANSVQTLTLSNTGVLSLTGTANEIQVSSSTGDTTLSLPSTVVMPGTLSVTGALTANDGLTVNNGVATLGQGINLAGGNILGTSSSFAYTIGANPTATFTAGGFIQLFGSTSSAPSTINFGTNNTDWMTLESNGTFTSRGLIQTTSTGGFNANGPAATQMNVLTMTQGSQPSWIFFQPASSTDFNLFNGSLGTVASWHQAGGLTINGQIVTNTGVSTAFLSADNNAVGVQCNSPTVFNFNAASFNPFPSATGVTSGAYCVWNLTNGVGEQSFVNVFEGSSGQGGFKWWQTVSTPSLNSIMTLSPTGALTVVSVTQTSDATKKTNVVKITNASSIVSSLNGVRFDWKDGTGKSVGLIAQDVEKVLPELVSTTDGIKGVNYSGITAVLVEVVKEQSQEIKELREAVKLLMTQFKFTGE
jgi:Chaperone of endosialidase